MRSSVGKQRERQESVAGIQVEMGVAPPGWMQEI